MGATGFLRSKLQWPEAGTGALLSDLRSNQTPVSTSSEFDLTSET
jgi:hypothetical protein